MRWDESKHPRDKGGKFTDGIDESSSAGKEFTTGRFAKKDNESITKRDYSVTFSPVHLKIGAVRKQLQQEGSAITAVFTWSHRYIVEIRNEEGFPYTILDKVRI